MDEAAVGTQDQNITGTQTQVVQDAQQEKLLKQSEVDALVGRLKHEAYEKGKRDADVQRQNTSVSPGQSMGGIQQLTEEQVRQMIADEAQKQNQFNEAKVMLDNFVNQMGTGKSKYSDFDETVARLGNLQNIPHVVKLATETGIAGDVMYELGRNPAKVASLTTLAYINPQLAEDEMKKLSNSIKTNQEALHTPDIAAPLSQIKPSTTAGKDNGSFTVRDFRNKYRG